MAMHPNQLELPLRKETRMSVSDKAWASFSPADYSIEQWRSACLVDTGQGDPNSKDRYKLPVREPSGVLNRNAVHDAAARIGQMEPASMRAGAAKKLMALYRQMGETPPESMMMMAKRSGSGTPAESRELIYTAGVVELRADGDGRNIGGYALKFDTYSQNLGGYVERIAPCFPNRARSEGWPGLVCRYNHKDDFLLGSVQSGTLRMGLDEIGLSYEVNVPHCRNDVLEMVTRRDVQHSSFAFIAVDEEWGQTPEQGYPCRTLVSGQILDVAPVATPAYRDTSVGLRSLAEYVNAPLEDVMAAAENNALNRFFVRTDNNGQPVKQRKPLQGPAAKLHILEKKRSY